MSFVINKSAAQAIDKHCTRCRNYPQILPHLFCFVAVFVSLPVSHLYLDLSACHNEENLCLEGLMVSGGGGYIYKDSYVDKAASPWYNELYLSVKDVSYSFKFLIVSSVKQSYNTSNHSP